MYTNTKIWLSTLAPQDDINDVYRDRLRQVYVVFRERVGQLIQTIPADMLGLTVHDLTHLDALWEMLDLLTGGNYDLNPAEAFVLGGAILLHDSAMTVCAYTGGIGEIRQTAEYADALAQFRSLQPTTPYGQATAATTSAEEFALGEVLRVKHASKAEELASQKWKSPIDASEVYLIDDADIRDHYSRSIGRIAHSHNWNIGDIPKFLGTKLGAFSGFPTAWTIDQVKLALLLRCIDALHIDDRRAPRFLAAIRNIGKESMVHWKFQNKLTQPHLEEGKIVYSSKCPFEINDAEAWNLCFDTIQMIDRELRDSNDLQLQLRLPQLRATGVAGAGSAESLARYIEVKGWKPLPLNLKVSNVPSLARTLGGKDLYANPLAPLRELIQNAADAIEARTLVESEFGLEDGSICVRFIESEGETILEIDDNGVGMSERVLTTALLDFGFSFWKSSAARSELPGIQSETNRFRGRYGIGFFSVFMWSSEIVACSRRFNEGLDEARVLEFRQGLESRPILRPATSGESSSKWTTRIRLKLRPDFLKTAVPRDRDLDRMRRFAFREPEHFVEQDWPQKIKLLCGALPIKVTLEMGGRIDEVSLPSWRTCESNAFLDFFSGALLSRGEAHKRFVSTLTPLTDPPPLGGRCFINPYNRGSTIAIYEKGIFIGLAHSTGVYGVVESKAINAARDQYAGLSFYKDKGWIEKIRPKAFAACRNIAEKIAIQHILLGLDKPDTNQPLFIRNREFISLSELKRQIAIDGIFQIVLTEESDDTFSWKAAENLSTITGLNIDEKRVYPLVDFRGQVNANDDIDKMVGVSEEPLFSLLQELRDVFGPAAKIESFHQEREGYRKDYIEIRIRGGSAGDVG